MLFFKFLFNGIKYRFYRLTGCFILPQALSIEITRRCIARCLMCNIWKTPPGTLELTIEEWLNLMLSSALKDLREIDVTGGEPFLRKDLVTFLRGIFDIKNTNLKKLRSISITTNGFLTDKIISVISQILPKAKDKNIEIVIVFAMDGIGFVHDEIRRVKGGWQRVDKSIQEMKKFKKLYNNLILGLKTTILPINIVELFNIVNYAMENDLFTIISPFIITKNRYDNTELKSLLQFSADDIQEILKFYSNDLFKWDYHRKMLFSFFQTGNVKKPCSAGFNYFFIRSNGDLFPCPLIYDYLGNIKEASFDDLINSDKAVNFRKKIKTYKECMSCTEPGLERYALSFEGFQILRLLFTIGIKRFINFYIHMGLKKYE